MEGILLTDLCVCMYLHTCKLYELNILQKSIPFQEPEIYRCSMLEVEWYDVTISQCELTSIKSNTTTLLYEYLDDSSNITITVNIVVVDSRGQRSNSTVIMKTIYIQNAIPSK